MADIVVVLVPPQQQGDMSTAPLPALPENTRLDSLAAGVLHVFEVYTKVPFDIYRTVEPSQTTPAVHSVAPNAFSKLAPLICAGFAPDEYVIEADVPAEPVCLAWDPSKKEKKLHVRGLSLYMTHPTTLRAFADFGEPVLDRAERTYCSLGDLPPSRCACDDEHPAGILTSPLLADDDCLELGNLLVSNATLPVASLPANSPKNGKRKGYLCYSLTAGTDLSPHGLAVMIDDNDPSTPGHVSLVPWPRGDPAPAIATHSWRPQIDPSSSITILTRTPPPGQPPTPERILRTLPGRTTFPLVAQLFTVHCFQMKGSVGPVMDPDDPDSPGGSVAAFEAAEILYKYIDGPNDPLQVQVTILALNEANFNLARVAPSSITTFHSLLDVVIDMCTEEEAATLRRAQDDLELAMKVVLLLFYAGGEQGQIEPRSAEARWPERVTAEKLA